MACVVKRRNQQMSQFIIENPELTVKNSIEFLKKMTVAMISSISSARKIFPESSFETRRFIDTKLKILKGTDRAPGSRSVVECIKNAIKYIDSNDLHKLFLIIQNENNGATIEVYTIHFTYKEEEIKCHIQMTNDEQEMHSNNSKDVPNEIMQQIKTLLFNLEDYTNKLPPLPESCELKIHLHLRDRIDLILPPLFEKLDSHDLNFPPNVQTLKLGHADSKLTAFGVFSKSALLSMEEHEEDNMEVCANSPCGPNKKYYSSPLPICNDLKENSETVKLSDTMSSVHLRDKEVKCICEKDDDMQENIKCTVCHTYQHKACYKLLDHQTVDKHVCVNCHVPNSKAKTCTNPELLSEKGKDEAFYRRALSLCESLKKVSLNTFVSHLNMPRKEAKKIFCRLIDDGCFLPETKGCNVHTVNLQHLKDNILVFHFNTVNNEAPMDTDDEECIPASNPSVVKGNSGKRNFDMEEETNPKRTKLEGSDLYASSTPKIRSKRK